MLLLPSFLSFIVSVEVLFQFYINIKLLSLMVYKTLICEKPKCISHMLLYHKPSRSSKTSLLIILRNSTWKSNFHFLYFTTDFFVVEMCYTNKYASVCLFIPSFFLSLSLYPIILFFVWRTQSCVNLYVCE